MHCGMDFGTSNSAVGVAATAGVELIPLEGRYRTIPSASFYPVGQPRPEVGRKAIRAYIDGAEGRFMRSMKSVLGTSVMDESTQIGEAMVPLRSVVAHYVVELKRRAEAVLGYELRQVVQGRPVHFVDGDRQADTRAQAVLEGVLHEAGFREVVFEFEPVAAAAQFESSVNRETLAFIADIGGGTSDFSLVRVSPSGTVGGGVEVLANHGVRVGGTDFDQQLSLAAVMPLLGHGERLSGTKLVAPRWIYVDLASPSRIAMLYDRKNHLSIFSITESSRHDPRFARLRGVMIDRSGHHIANDVEQAKIRLTDADTTVIRLDYVAAGLEAAAEREILAQAISRPLEQMGDAVEECVRQAGVTQGEVPLVVMTGGSTEMPLVQAAITARLPGARIERCDRFGAVAAGLARRAEKVFE